MILARKPAYGGVVLDDNGRVLIRKPTSEFDGYKWTFPKGRSDAGESPEATALREVLEECGVVAKIVGRLPGSFPGGTTDNHYFLMRSLQTGLPTDAETQEVRWVTWEEARSLFSQNTNPVGRERDLAVLDVAKSAYVSAVSEEEKANEDRNAHLAGQ